MGEFGLTVSLEGVLIGFLGESERIEESNRVEGSDHGFDERSNGGGGGGSLLGEGGESSGRSGSEDDGGSSELHFDICLCFEFVLELFKFDFMGRTRMQRRKTIPM